MQRALASLAVAMLALGGCTARRAAAPEQPAEAAIVHVYLEPPPEDAPPVHADIAGVSLVRADGTRVPLEPAPAAAAEDRQRRQRLLARGAVPPGTYTGLEVAIARASLSGRALSVPEPASLANLSLALERQGAALLLLRMQADEAVLDEGGFHAVLSAGPPGGLAPGASAVAVGRAEPVLSTFHKLEGTVFGLVRTPAGPTAVALESSGQRAYVACADADVIQPVDLTHGVREPAFPLAAGDGPTALALSRDGRTLVVANTGSDTVTVLDAPALAQRFRVPVGVEPVAVLLAPDDRRAFVLNRRSDSISVIDLVGEVTRTVETEPGPRAAVLDRSGTRLYVGHRDSPYLVSFRLPGLVRERQAYVGTGLVALAIDPRTDRLYVARRAIGAVEVFDPGSLLPIDRIATGGDALHLTIDPEGERLHAAMARGRQVRSFAIVGRGAASQTDLGTDPAWISVAGGG